MLRCGSRAVRRTTGRQVWLTESEQQAESQGNHFEYFTLYIRYMASTAAIAFGLARSVRSFDRLGIFAQAVTPNRGHVGAQRLHNSDPSARRRVNTFLLTLLKAPAPSIERATGRRTRNIIQPSSICVHSRESSYICV